MTSCNKCGKEITFDSARKSASGKHIPIDKDTNEPHNCPNSTFSKKQQTLEPEPAAEPAPTPEPAAESAPTPEPAAESAPTPEPAAESAPTPEPAAEPAPTPEPAAESAPTPAAEAQMFEDKLEGTLLSVRDEGMSSEFIIWFPFSKKAMKKLREGVLLTAKNYSSTDTEDHWSVMQVTNAVPTHYALGIAGKENIEAYPGFLDVAYGSAFRDLDKDMEDESTKILCRAAPTNLELKRPSSITSLNPVTKIDDETSLPILGSPVNVLTADWHGNIFNKGIMENPDKIEIGKLANFPEVSIFILWKEMIRTHFGIFAYTNAGKSNLTSTYLSKIFGVEDAAKAVIYDLQNEYGGLLIDILCNNENSSIVYTDEGTVDQAIQNYWHDQTDEGKLDAAATVLTNTTILPKDLLIHRQRFFDPYKFLLRSGRVKLLTVTTEGTLRGTLTGWRDELYDDQSQASQAKEQFMVWMNTQIGTFGNEEIIDEVLERLSTEVETETTRVNALTGAAAQIRTAMMKLTRYVEILEAQITNTNPVPERFTITYENIRDSLNNRDTKSLYILQGEEGSVRAASDHLGGIMMEERRLTGVQQPVISFVYDEADQFIPQETRGLPNSEESKARARNIARRGRKYGVGLGIGTQRIVYLDTNVLGQPHTYFVSKLPRVSDRDTIKEAFGLSDRALDQTHKFKRGVWMLVSHDATGIDGEPIIVKLDNANERIREFITGYQLPPPPPN